MRFLKALQITSIRDQASEQGSAMLFAAVIMVPLLFVCFTLTLDFETYFHQQSKAQQMMDDAAMYAYRFLPNTKSAEAAAKLYLNQDPSIGSVADVKVSSDTVSITLRTMSHLTFGEGVVRLTGSDAEVGLPIALRSEIRGVPLDAFVAMDLGASSAPALTLGGAPWGDPGPYPPARFFVDGVSLRPTPESSSKFDSRLTTQRCFNPLSTGVKLATIGLYRKLSNFRLNSVGLGVYPGNLQSVDVVRGVGQSDRSTWAPGKSGEVDWIGHEEATVSHVTNSHCFKAAEEESPSGAYPFPDAPSSLEYLWKPPVGSSSTGSRVERGSLNNTWSFDPQFQASLSASELIWSQATRDATGDLREVMNEVVRSVLASQTRKDRGGLETRGVKVGFIISADLPTIGGARFPSGASESALRSYLASIRTKLEASGLTPGNGVTIYYILSSREVIGGESFQDVVEQLGATFAASSSATVRFRVIYGSTPEVLSSSAVEAALAESRRGIISK